MHSTIRESSRGLGMEQDITRRDFLNAALLASGGLLLTPASPLELLQARAASSAEDDWTGYGGVGDYANSNGNTTAILEAGHQIRDGKFESLPSNLIDTGETYDCVVVGGGISGLAAALIFQRQAGPGKTCLVLDNHPIFGGEAKRNEFLVDGHRLVAHQGSAFFPVPYPRSFIGRFYESIGLKTPRLEYQKWSGQSGEAGAQPQYPGDVISRRLDAITLEAHMMERHGLSRETIRTFLSPVEGGGYGLGPDALSGYTAYAADMLHPLDISDETGQQMFPDGNGGLARLITKTLIPESIAGEHSLQDVCRNAVNFAALDHPGAAARIRLDSTVYG
jgi:spermidine dehydrogenase